MSATTTAASGNIRASVDDLIAQVERGEILPAFETYYAENISMQENSGTPTVGKAANRTREEAFVGSVAEVHENRAVSRLVDGERAVILWAFEFTGKDGNRYRLDQVAHQEWEEGRIVRERFIYDSASVLVAAAGAAEKN